MIEGYPLFQETSIWSYVCGTLWERQHVFLEQILCLIIIRASSCPSPSWPKTDWPSIHQVLLPRYPVDQPRVRDLNVDFAAMGAGARSRKPYFLYSCASMALVLHVSLLVPSVPLSNKIEIIIGWSINTNSLQRKNRKSSTSGSLARCQYLIFIRNPQWNHIKINPQKFTVLHCGVFAVKLTQQLCRGIASCRFRRSESSAWSMDQCDAYG